jgi:hypothetical protein
MKVAPSRASECFSSALVAGDKIACPTISLNGLRVSSVILAMNMKLPWVILAVLCALFVTSHAQTPAGSAAPQRFEIFSTARAVFRIDTQTGQVSTYQEGTVGVGDSPTGRPLRYAYWQRIDEKWLMHDTAEEARQAEMRP